MQAKVMQMEYQNQMAGKPLILPIVVLPNTPDDEIRRNIKINSARDLEWMARHEPHDGVAILVGGGSSINDHVDTIKGTKGTVFAMNGASKWCGENGIEVDYQFILDAKEETQLLVDHNAKQHIFGSQVNPKTMESVSDPIVWHCHTGNDIEKDFPQEKVDKGGYVLLSGGSAVGNSSMTVVYALGFREFHIFGFDSCHKEAKSHAYEQPMNRFIPTVQVKWAGKTYTSSVAMKAHAEDFQVTSQALKRLGCKFTLYGDGLLQQMYRMPPSSEKEKYQLMWQYPSYRTVCPGEHVVDAFLDIADPDGIIIDYGCGTGRTSLALSNRGHDVMLLDFTDNSRDPEACDLPFVQWDLTNPIPMKADYGICTDVMEHIPPEDVLTVINNIMESAHKVFFQISTIDDSMGELIEQPLHLTVKPHSWWENLFCALGYKVDWEAELDNSALFYVSNPDRRETCQ